jgi:hypothetical protein
VGILSFAYLAFSAVLRALVRGLERFGLPVTEVVIDRDRRVISVSAD